MNTAIAGDINGAPVQCGLSGAERMGVSHEEFRSTRRRGDGDRVGRRHDVGRLDRSGNLAGDLIVAATSPVLYPIGTAMKATGTLAAMVRVRLEGVAVVAAGA
jgi:hypothetical protein